MFELASTARGSARNSQWRGAIGFGLGILLLTAAAVAILSAPERLSEAVAHIRQADLGTVAIFLVLPFVSWLAVSAGFRVLTVQYGPVTRLEMTSLIGAAWLLNYLPMRPGMIGRVAYHKRYNGIDVKDSVRVVIMSSLLNLVAAFGVFASVKLAGGAVWVTDDGSGEDRFAFSFGVILPLVLPLIGAASGAFLTRLLGLAVWRLWAALAWKVVDVLIWAVRYFLAFAMIGQAISPGQAAVIAAISHTTLLLPIAGNGLGVREWVVRLISSPAGLLADVLGRAVEIVAAVIAGAAGSMYLAHRVRRHGRAAEK